MKKLKGKLIRLKNDKTAIVLVARKKIHPIYHKAVKMTKNYPVDNEVGAKKDDWVVIGECRPISKTKNWKVVEVIK